MEIYKELLKRKKAAKKTFAILIDPDRQDNEQLIQTIRCASQAEVDYFFVGGSLLIEDNLEKCIQTIKHNSSIPVVLFPGNAMQISKSADAILFLSLISGRNPELLIGKQVITAPILKQTDIEVISTGYMLINSGKPTTASYMSNTNPIPYEKTNVAACTAMAGEFLGMKLIYMDGGSGAETPISMKMINTVSKTIDIPLIIGGGITSAKKALENCQAGADIIVVGNAIEKDNSIIKDISEAVHSF
jgi:putative glycerol-1-phosphate prenyltransferase